MNDIWHFLREFESKDLIKRYIKDKFGYEPNSEKSFEIISAFKQGRSYFEAVMKADVSVRPLLQYYGIVSLARGLVLVLNKKARENNIKPSHGLKITNWSEVAKHGKYEDLKLITSSGTFKELINATDNKSYFRAGSSGINWFVQYPIPEFEYDFTLKDLAYSLPDLRRTIETWLGCEFPSRELINFKQTKGEHIELEVQGKSREGLDLLFPEIAFKNEEIVETPHNLKIKYETQYIPHLCQHWQNSFQVIGAAYVAPPLNLIYLVNDIAKMYAVSFILGTISRYHPKSWNDINSGIKNDSILPFAINFMDFTQEKFPQIIKDFIDSPYKFESE